MISQRFVAYSLCSVIVFFFFVPTASAKWKYFRVGNAEDSTAIPRGAFALMGGGAE
jgi:hypothetical protein